MTGYAIAAAAAAFSAGLFLQAQASDFPSSIGRPTVALRSHLGSVGGDANSSSTGRGDAGRPRPSGRDPTDRTRADHKPEPMSVRDARLLVLAVLALGLRAEGGKATLSKRH